MAVEKFLGVGGPYVPLVGVAPRSGGGMSEQESTLSWTEGWVGILDGDSEGLRDSGGGEEQEGGKEVDSFHVRMK